MRRALLPLLTFALTAAVVKAQDYVWTTNNGAITINDYIGAGGSVIIPDTITGFPVTAIRSRAFEGAGSVTSVVVPNSVTNIGSRAFFQCEGLTNVTLPNGLTSIAPETFRSCFALQRADVPGTVTMIGDYAFESCQSLENITLSESLITVGDYAFSFAGLTNVTIPGSVTNIGRYTFYGCTSLSSISVEPLNSRYSSSDGVLFNKDSTTLVQYPGGRTGDYAIPDGVTTVARGAFFWSQKLTNVAIPSTVTNMGTYPFSVCTTLDAIDVDPQNPVYSSLDGVLFDKSQTTLIQYPGGRAGDYVIPNGVTTLAEIAFNSRSLTNVTVPDTVTHVSFPTFSTCTSLVGVMFMGNPPAGIPGGSYFQVFRSCDSITVYYLPGTYSWGSTWSGRPTALWNPQVAVSGGMFGVGPAGFGFTVFGTTGIPIVIQACTNLAERSWSPLQSCTLTNGSAYISDPDWMDYPSRFYTISWP